MKNSLLKNQFFHISIPNGNLLHVPVKCISGVGDVLSGKDIVTVCDCQSLNLTYNEVSDSFEDDFTIDSISGYDIYKLDYNISTLIAKTDLYPVETEGNVPIDLSYDFSRVAIAQSFEVVWDFAVFSGAKLYLDEDGQVGGTLLDLFST